MMDANGIDIFHGDNAERLPDFGQIAMQGIWFVVHKASQGLGGRDLKFVDRIKAAQAAGLLTGAYHFMDASDPIAQADHFLSVAKPFLGADANFALFADYERSAHSPALHQLYDFMRRVEEGAPGVMCGVYSGDLIRETLTPPKGGLVAPWYGSCVAYMRSHRLWLAEYGPHERIPWPWSEAPQFCDMWQFSETGRLRAVLGALDFDLYTGGDRAKLTADWKAGPPIAARIAAGGVVSAQSNRGNLPTT